MIKTFGISLATIALVPLILLFFTVIGTAILAATSWLLTLVTSVK